MNNKTAQNIPFCAACLCYLLYAVSWHYTTIISLGQQRASRTPIKSLTHKTHTSTNAPIVAALRIDIA